jgi:hypothetical protein
MIYIDLQFKAPLRKKFFIKKLFLFIVEQRDNQRMRVLTCCHNRQVVGSELNRYSGEGHKEGTDRKSKPGVGTPTSGPTLSY